MDKSIEGEAISPASGKVADVYIRVASSLDLTPKQQGIFSRLGLTAIYFFYGDVLNLNKNYFCPY